MAEVMKCPACGREYEDGRRYCGFCFSQCKPIKEEEDVTPDDFSGDEDAAQVLTEDSIVDTDDGSVRCPDCGALGQPGEKCVQCGALLPMVQQECAVQTVALCMPDGSRLPFVAGSEIAIGRESEDKSIQSAFKDFDGVSRKHCHVKISSDGRAITVWDDGSTNGTRVGEATQSLKRGELATSPIPTLIHLGKNCVVHFEYENSGGA